MTLNEYVEDALDFERGKYESEFPDGDFDEFGDFISEVRGRAAQEYCELYGGAGIQADAVYC